MDSVIGKCFKYSDSYVLPIKGNETTTSYIFIDYKRYMEKNDQNCFRYSHESTESCNHNLSNIWNCLPKVPNKIDKLILESTHFPKGTIKQYNKVFNPIEVSTNYAGQLIWNWHGN